MDLTDRDRAILDFERSWWVQPGSKTDAIRTQLALSATRYYEVLGSLIDTTEAEAYDPLVVRRLRRVRSDRRRARYEGRRAGGRPGR
jgi:hypothetical protein